MRAFHGISLIVGVLAAVILVAPVFMVVGCGPPGEIERRPTGKKSTDDPSKKIPVADGVCKDIVALNDPVPLANLGELSQRFLTGHNVIRKMFNLSDMTWDTNLADYAQRWAEYLKKNNTCLMKHRSHAGMEEGKNFGENLAYNWISKSIAKGKFVRSPEAVVYSWSKECKDYDYQTMHCTPGEQCGHYTQVVWRKSTRVGCGMVICDGAENDRGIGRVELWVCNYDPPGNWVGQRPY